MESPERSPAERPDRVARALSALQAGVRQRQSETACGEAGEVVDQAMVAGLIERATLEEPVCVSPRPVVGALLVAVRKAHYQLFGRWHAQPAREQQSEFNRALTRVARDLLAELREAQRRGDRLERRLARLERRLEDRRG